MFTSNYYSLTIFEVIIIVDIIHLFNDFAKSLIQYGSKKLKFVCKIKLD